jgi:hypothetical protein
MNDLAKEYSDQADTEVLTYDVSDAAIEAAAAAGGIMILQTLQSSAANCC